MAQAQGEVAAPAVRFSLAPPLSAAAFLEELKGRQLQRLLGGVDGQTEELVDTSQFLEWARKQTQLAEQVYSC